MPKFYAVELRTIAIVQVADDKGPLDAERVADYEQTDILSDARHNSLEIDCHQEITSVKELESLGWDGKCLPYGGDGNTRLEDLLPAK